MPARVAIYARQSHTTDGSESLDLQLQSGRETARRLGAEVVAELIEPPSTSGYRDRGRGRPRFKELLELLRGGEVETVIVYKTDRLSRGGGAGYAEFNEACESAGLDLDRVVTTAQGFVSEFELGIRATMDREQSSRLSEQMCDSKARTASRGRPNGGRRPFGYADARFSKIVPQEARLIRAAAKRLLGGESLRSISLDWSRREVPRPGGGGVTWGSSHVGRTLRSPYLAALRVTKDGLRVPGTWKAILTVEQHEALLLTAGEHRAASVRRHLLTGLARCGACDGTMRGKTTRRFGLQYACQSPTCGRSTVNGPRLEAHVLDEVLRFLATAKLRPLPDGNGPDRRTELRRLVKEDGTALKELTRARFVDRIIADPEFREARALLVERRERNEALAAALDRRRRDSVVALPPGERGALDRWWERANLEERRVGLGSSVARVVVNPTSVRGRAKFDEDRVVVAFRWDLYLRAVDRFEAEGTPEEWAQAERDYAEESWQAQG